MYLPAPVIAALPAVAARHELDVYLLAAFVMQESGGETSAWNPEPKYRYLWDVRDWKPFRTLTADENASEIPPADFHKLGGQLDQEWWGQQASWGLMQVMGAVAREHGFREIFFTKLCNMDVGLAYGARHLAGLFARGFDMQDAISAYNAGHPTHENYYKYTSPVLQWVDKLRKERAFSTGGTA